jgi:uncharacterized protein YvpB
MATLSHSAIPQTAQSCAFKGFTDLSSFSKISPWQTGETDYLSPVIDAKMDWNELVASWDVQASPGAKVSVMARAIYPDHESKFYVLSIWSSDPSSPDRTSLKGQKDADGTVDIDTLILEKKTNQVQLLIATRPGPDAVEPTVKFLGLCFADNSSHPDAVGPAVPTLAPLDVPEKCQMNYPNGGGYCSATSVSMVLNYWSQKLNRPELAKDVPDVVAGVLDSGFKGTGNWPFNTAYAATFPGLRAYVTRFATVDEIREWLQSGFPVITSASLPLLEGKPRPKDDAGHLVVLVGFSADGDPIFNDPAHSDVRRTYKRADFEKAWDTSERTVYLIYPESMTPPEDKFGHWFTQQ